MGGNITFTNAEGITFDLDTIKKDKMFDNAPTEMYITEKTQHDNHIKHVKPRKRYKPDTRKVARTKIYKRHEILREIKFMTGQREDRPKAWNILAAIVSQKGKRITNSTVANLMGLTKEQTSGQCTTVRKWLEAREWCGLETIDRVVYFTYDHYETDVDKLYEDHLEWCRQVAREKRAKKLSENNQEKPPEEKKIVEPSTKPEEDVFYGPDPDVMLKSPEEDLPQPSLTVSIQDDSPIPQVDRFSKVYLQGKEYGLIDLSIKKVIAAMLSEIGFMQAITIIEKTLPAMPESEHLRILKSMKDFTVG